MACSALAALLLPMLPPAHSVRPLLRCRAGASRADSDVIIDARVTSSRACMSSSRATVRASSLRELLPLLQPGDAIYLDLDDTLISPEPDACESWCWALKERMIAEGAEPQAAWLASVQLWQGLQGSCLTTVPEGDDTLAVVAELRKRGHSVVGLTARGPEVAGNTHVQLTRCGLAHHFDVGALGTESPASPSSDPRLGPSAHTLEPAAPGQDGREEDSCHRADGRPLSTQHAPLAFERGVVYCSGARKPEGLLAFERAAGRGQGRVVLVDDRVRHIDALAAEMERQGRPFLGIHYTHVADRRGAEYELPRGWALLAAAMVHDRDNLRGVLDRLDSPPTSGDHSATRGGALVAAAALATGLVLGAGLARSLAQRG